MRRVPLLARLAGRYALRHKTQTLRALLGLLVATTVLVTGLGMGESITVSLEERALARFGPIDLSLRSAQPFPAHLIDDIQRDARLTRLGIQGAATMSVVGPASHPENGLAEAFASIRGVSAREREALGPLRGVDGAVIPEPQRGEVVLSHELANRLGAHVGDAVVLRAPPPGGFDSFEPVIQDLRGAAGPLVPAPSHTIRVEASAIALGVELRWPADAGRVTVEARSPSGIAYANATTSSPIQLVVEGPLEAGDWTLTVTAERLAAYVGGAGVLYLPASLTEGFATLPVRVVAISADEGRAAITGRPTALVNLGQLQSVLGLDGMATGAYFAAPGEPHESAEAVRRAYQATGERQWEVEPDKANAIERAREAGAGIAGFLLTMGAFTLVAAVLLAFTLFSALVEERRAELGISRALGLTRGEVAFSMTLEGALYAGAAAIVGLLLGVGILATLLPAIGSMAAAQGGPRFAMHVSTRTLVASLALGILVPLATIGFASLRFARLDPARAIRGLPDDPRGRRRLGFGFALGLTVAGLLLLLPDLGWLVAVPILAAAATVLLGALGWSRMALVAAALGIAHVAYTLYTHDEWPRTAGELDPILTLARGGLLALGLSALAVSSPRPYQALLGMLSRAGSMRGAFVAVKYLLARRRPVGLTMAMVALVVVVVTVMGTLFAVFGSSIAEEEAGYAIIGESPLAATGFPRPLPDDVASDIARADFLPAHTAFRPARVNDSAGLPRSGVFGTTFFVGVTPGFAEANEYEIVQRAPQYADDDAVWEAVVRGDAILFVDRLLRTNGFTAGDTLTLAVGNAPERQLVIAGSYRSQFASQSFLSVEHVESMGFPQRAQVYVRMAEGADPDVTAHRLTALYAEDGLSFTSIPEEVRRVSEQVQALVLVFEAFLALGLFVGLAATGFLASRAVHERMRDIGTLRALGYEERDVRGAFVLESTLTAGAGLLIGTLVGLLVAHSIWWRGARDNGVVFQPPILLLVLFSLAVLALAALASRGPAKRAAALPPAIAVRHVE